LPIAGDTVEVGDYCREVERYLCQKNDGHLIRVVGPSFDLVSRWAVEGVPLKVAFRGIDRYVERYYRKGPRRRPVRIDFCEADILEVFDEWRRATGMVAAHAPAEGGTAARPDPGAAVEPRRGPSLPSHLERVGIALTNARATDTIGPEADAVIDGISRELDAARAPGGVRGDARRAVIERLAALDHALLALMRSRLDESDVQRMQHEAAAELSAYRAGMPPDGYERALQAVLDRLVRERFKLPIVTYD
jgi:hypothetical protein